MISGLVRLVLVAIVLVILATVVVEYRNSWPFSEKRPVVSKGPINEDRAREVGAEVGEATAKVANEAKEELAKASVTMKIKAKMALDDLVKARNISVETTGTVVTLTGTVDSETERRRAVQLAKETEGVTSVIDRLRVR